MLAKPFLQDFEVAGPWSFPVSPQLGLAGFLPFPVKECSKPEYNAPPTPPRKTRVVMQCAFFNL